MIRFILSLLILSIAMVIGYLVTTFPANVIIDFPNYIININLIVWLALCFIVSIIIWYGMRFLVFIWKSPILLSRNNKERKKRLAEKLLQQALGDMIAGFYHKAENKLIKGAKIYEQLNENALIFYENAAVAANYQKEITRRDEYLLQARKVTTMRENHVTQLGEAQLLVENKEYDKACPMLQKMLLQQPDNLKVLTLLDQCFCALQDWQAAWDNLNKLGKYLEEDVVEEKIEHYAKAMFNDSSKKDSYIQLANAWELLPQNLRQQTNMILQYSSSLIANNYAEEAEKFLCNEIKKNWHSELIQAYSQIEGIDHARQLRNMQKWQEKQEENYLFFYAFALIALKAGQAQLAAEYIEKSISLKENPESFILWAQILEALKQPDAALAAYRQSFTTLPFPNIPMIGEFIPATQPENENNN